MQLHIRNIISIFFVYANSIVRVIRKRGIFMKNIKRITSCIMALLLCVCTATMNVSAAEAPEMHTVVQPTYQSTADELVVSSTKEVKHNQVWIDAGQFTSGAFLVENPHNFGGNGFGRLRLESNDPNVEMHVMVTNGSTSTYCAYQVIRVGNNGERDITFNYNSFAQNLKVHYWVKTSSNTHGMRLNCYLS